MYSGGLRPRPEACRIFFGKNYPQGNQGAASGNPKDGGSAKGTLGDDGADLGQGQQVGQDIASRGGHQRTGNVIDAGGKRLGRAGSAAQGGQNLGGPLAPMGGKLGQTRGRGLDRGAVGR